mgnify:CR=1 FL=1
MSEAASGESYQSENAARQALIEACLKMNALGINQGKAGNASLRWHRGGEDGLLITPAALPYEQMQTDDIAWISLRVQIGRAHV